MQKIMEVKNLKKYFPLGKGFLSADKGTVKAVDDVSLDIFQGETLGVVGESGCGKSTFARTILGLHKATEGEVLFQEKKVFELKGKELRSLRQNMQLIFQDPYSSLNPRFTVGQIVEEPLIIHDFGNKAARRERVVELMEIVGLSKRHLNRYPHEFSGGQRQRIGIARALAMNPKLVVCDEPVSALDVSIQSQILNLLRSLQQKLDLTYVFIAHDLSVVKHVSDRVAVMYLGKLVELASVDDLYSKPLHPYTQALLSAIPDPNPLKRKKKMLLKGDVPSPANPPSGCRFHTRCPYVKDICKKKNPEMQVFENKHQVACHFANNLEEQTE